jgi:hypothetical protein
VTYHLPQDLARCGLLAGLNPAQLADAIADAVLAGLAAHGGDGWPTRPARCTCLAIDTTVPAASEEILRSLIVAWLTVHVTTSTGQAPAVIIAGFTDRELECPCRSPRPVSWAS